MKRLLAVILAAHYSMSVMADDLADLREQLVAAYLDHCDGEHGFDAETCFGVAEAWYRQGPSVFDERKALSMAANVYANVAGTSAAPVLTHRALERSTAIYNELRNAYPEDGSPLFGLAHLAAPGPERYAMLEEMIRLQPEDPVSYFMLGSELLESDDPAYSASAAEALWRAWSTSWRRPEGGQFGYARTYLSVLEDTNGPQEADAARTRIRQSCNAEEALALVGRVRHRPLEERVSTLKSLTGPYCYDPYRGIDDTTCQNLIDEARQLAAEHPDAVDALVLLAELIESLNSGSGVTWSGAQILACMEPVAATELRPIYSRILELDPGSVPGRWGMANITPNVYQRLEALVSLARDETEITEEQRLSLAEDLVLMAWTDEAVTELEALLGSTSSSHVRWRAHRALIDAHLAAGDSRAAARVWLERDRGWPDLPPPGPTCRPEHGSH